MSGVYDLAGARKAGITDEDSLSHLASVHGYDLAGARAAGIPDSESLSHLAVVKAAPEPVVEKESPEAMGGIGATLGGIGAAGDVIYSKGRPLFRGVEKALGMDTGTPTVKPRTFLDPSTVAEQAIARRAATAPDVTGSPSAVKTWAGTQHEGDFLGGAEYGEADKIKKEAMAFEKANPTQKVLPGSLIAVPEEEAKRLAQQRAELAAQQDIAKQAEVRQVAQTRAERLGERAELKGKSNKFGAAKGAGSLVGKVAMPVVGGYELGSQGAQAYNRLTRPDLTARDVGAGAANVVGAGAGALSMVPSKYRVPAAIIAQGAGAIANWLDKRNPRNEEVVEIPQKAQGGLVHLADGGPPLPGKLGKAAKLVQKAAHEIGGKETSKLSDWAQNHIDEWLVPTQADRMGGVGGPSYSANQIALPEYKGRAWGSGNKPTATMITNLAKDPRFGGVEKQNFTPLLGKENMHQSNQIMFDRMVEQFYKDPSKLPPDLAKVINDYMQSGGTISGKKSGFDPFPNFDIRDRSQVEDLGKTFRNRALIGQHAFGGEGIGGRKAQIIPYGQILQEGMDPLVADAKTFSLGPRMFKLTGEVEQTPRPDLNAAFPYQLLGTDAGVTVKPTPSELSLMDFQSQWRKDTGRNTPLRSGALPQPGYFEHTLGYKPAGVDERVYPRQQMTEDWVKELQRSGFAGGGAVQHFASGKLAWAERMGKGTLDLLKKTPEELLAARQAMTGFVQKQNPELAKAVDALRTGKISQKEYEAIRSQLYTPNILGAVPKKLSPYDIAVAIGPGKAKKGIVDFNVEIPKNEIYTTRLDIPGYEATGENVGSIVLPSGKTVYGQAEHLGDVRFESDPSKAMRVALGTKEQKLTPGAAEYGTAKSPFAVVEGRNLATDPDEIRRMMEFYNGDPKWRELGMNPYAQSQFFDKKTMAPAWNSDEVLKYGNFVLAKDPEMTHWLDPRLAVDAEKVGGIPGTKFAGGGKVIKGALETLAKKVMPLAEREANKAKFLEGNHPMVPEVVYHATRTAPKGDAIDQMIGSKYGTLGSGTYTTPDTKFGSTYTGIPTPETIEELKTSFPAMAKPFVKAMDEGDYSDVPMGGYMMPLHPSVKNPLILEGIHADPAFEALAKLGVPDSKIDAIVEKANDKYGSIGKEIQSRAQKAGHDGVILFKDGNVQEMVTYSPYQLKSAIGNEGDFNPYDPRLSKKRGGKIKK